MYLYLTLLLVNCLNMYLYLTLLLVKSLSMHLYLTLLLVSWPKDPLGGKTEYAAPRLQEATFLFQADTVEVQHVAPFFSLLQTNISCLPLCSFLENWFCCLFVPPLGALEQKFKKEEDEKEKIIENDARYQLSLMVYYLYQFNGSLIMKLTILFPPNI